MAVQVTHGYCLGNAFFTVSFGVFMVFAFPAFLLVSIFKVSLVASAFETVSLPCLGGWFPAQDINMLMQLHNSNTISLFFIAIKYCFMLTLNGLVKFWMDDFCKEFKKIIIFLNVFSIIVIEL